MIVLTEMCHCFRLQQKLYFLLTNLKITAQGWFIGQRPNTFSHSLLFQSIKTGKLLKIFTPASVNLSSIQVKSSNLPRAFLPIF